MNSAVTVKVLPPILPLPVNTASVLCEEITDWKLHINKTEMPASSYAHPLQVTARFEAANRPVYWQSSAAVSDRAKVTLKRAAALGNVPQAYQWPAHPTILALVPHWKCELWLSRALASLLHQTHPLTHIVVIDDASAQPPLEIAKQFANVTLLVASEHVGPYRLIQSVIDQTNYDAYLFQDADDWSSCDRLENLLKTARANGAELVGSQEIRVLESLSQLQAIGYPLNVNQALAHALGHPLLHPTSLVTRSLVTRSGGFATGLAFGGDTEFLLRVHWLARVVNSDRYCYFRRKRPHSLTTDPKTGLDSSARQSLIQAIKQRAIANHQAVNGQNSLDSIDLRPLQVAPAVELLHKWGPFLRWQG